MSDSGANDIYQSILDAEKEDQASILSSPLVWLSKKIDEHNQYFDDQYDFPSEVWNVDAKVRHSIAGYNVLVSGKCKLVYDDTTYNFNVSEDYTAQTYLSPDEYELEVFLEKAKENANAYC